MNTTYNNPTDWFVLDIPSDTEVLVLPKTNECLGVVFVRGPKTATMPGVVRFMGRPLKFEDSWLNPPATKTFSAAAGS